MTDLPPEINTPDLTPEERNGLMIAHEYFVSTGEAEWWITDEDDDG